MGLSSSTGTSTPDAADTTTVTRIVEHSRRPFWERMLGVVTVVHPGEGPTALMMTLNGFLLLMSYSLIKPVREALILAQSGGAEYKVYMAGATAAVLIFAVPIYSRFSRHQPRNRLVVAVTLFFASHLLLFYGLGKVVGSSLPFALVFYLWIAVFNMMIVAQFWAFANDLYDEKAGTRLFPLIALGASAGAVAGSAVAVKLVDRVGLLELMLVAAGFLLGSGAITQWVHQRRVLQAPTEAARATAVSPIGGNFGEAFRVVFAQRYLLLIAGFSLVFTLVKTNGDYLLAQIVKRAAARAVADGMVEPQHVGVYIGRFFAGFEFWVDLVSLAIQAFVVSRLVRYLGVSGAFWVLPIVALGDALTLFAFPILAAARIGKGLESAVDYSLNNTLRNMLWLRTSRRAKYLGKQAVDTLFVRLGDVSSALLVFVGIHLLGVSLRGFAAANVVLVGLWLALACTIVKARNRIRPEPEPAEVVTREEYGYA